MNEKSFLLAKISYVLYNYLDFEFRVEKQLEVYLRNGRSTRKFPTVQGSFVSCSGRLDFEWKMIRIYFTKEMKKVLNLPND